MPWGSWSPRLETCTSPCADVFRISMSTMKMCGTMRIPWSGCINGYKTAWKCMGVIIRPPRHPLTASGNHSTCDWLNRKDLKYHRHFNISCFNMYGDAIFDMWVNTTFAFNYSIWCTVKCRYITVKYIKRYWLENNHCKWQTLSKNELTAVAPCSALTGTPWDVYFELYGHKLPSYIGIWLY